MKAVFADIRPVAVSACFIAFVAVVVALPLPSVSQTPPAVAGSGITVTPTPAPSELRVMRQSLLRLRLTNGGTEILPGGSLTDYNAGKRIVFVGAWFSEVPPSVLGTFEHTTRLENPLAPGQTAELTLGVKPARYGPQYLGLGLFRSALDGQGNGPVGEVTSIPITVVPGSWVENHRLRFLQALVGGHLAGLALALLLLAVWSRR